MQQDLQTKITFHIYFCSACMQNLAKILTIALVIAKFKYLTFGVKGGVVKEIYYCPIEIIKGLTDNGQFQYLTKLKGSQEGTYLYTTQFLALR